MATHKFFLRNYEAEKDSTIYFKFVQSRDLVLVLKTPYAVNPKNWLSKNFTPQNETKKEKEFRESLTEDCVNIPSKTPRTTLEKNLRTSLTELSNNLDLFRIEFKKYEMNNPTATKQDFKDYVQSKYFPNKLDKTLISKKEKPQKFVDFIELYIREKSESYNGEQTPITDGTIKSYRRVKNHISQMRPNILISEIDNEFRKEYGRFCEKNRYNLNYQVKQLKYIKTFCKYAFEQLNYDNINSEVLRWDFKAATKKIRENSILHPIFSLEEVNKIRNHIFEHEYLDNARDWLLISIFTGQRVSDFLNFSKSKIVEKQLLEMVQKKTGYENTIFLLPDVISILKKRNGDFPRKISDQRYNEYIKKVCMLVGLDKMIEGEKSTLIDLNGRKVKRNVRDFYPKHELITSHIGRRSFVSIAVQKNINETAIMQQTGHKSTDLIRTYNQTNPKDKARLNGKELSKLKLIS